jgi:hypothetical protein
MTKDRRQKSDVGHQDTKVYFTTKDVRCKYHKLKENSVHHEGHEGHEEKCQNSDFRWQRSEIISSGRSGIQ